MNKLFLGGLILFSSMMAQAEVFSGKLTTIKANSIPTSCTYPFHGGDCSFSAQFSTKASVEYIRVTNLSLPEASFLNFFDLVPGETRTIDFNIEYDGQSSERQNMLSVVDGVNKLRIEYIEAGEPTLVDEVTMILPVRWNY